MGGWLVSRRRFLLGSTAVGVSGLLPALARPSTAAGSVGAILPCVCDVALPLLAAAVIDDRYVGFAGGSSLLELGIASGG